jgi:hypothetical protein
MSMAQYLLYAALAMALGLLVALLTNDPVSAVSGLVLVLLSFLLILMSRFSWALVTIAGALGIYIGMMLGL